MRRKNISYGHKQLWGRVVREVTHETEDHGFDSWWP